MKRHYYSQGKRREVDQIDDVLAILLPLDGQKDELLDPSELYLQSQNRFFDKELEPFTLSGWRFLSDKVAQARNHSTSRYLGVRAIGTICRRLEDGQLFITTQRLSIKLDPLLSEEAAKVKLENLGLKIIKGLKFAPNLFLVEIPPDIDVLDRCNQLREDSDILYAEPEVIEHCGHRSSK